MLKCGTIDCLILATIHLYVYRINVSFYSDRQGTKKFEDFSPRTYIEVNRNIGFHLRCYT